MQKISASLVFGGVQSIYQHDSKSTGTTMRLAAFVPSGDIKATVVWLSGLTCNEENFIFKSGFQRVAAEFGLLVICPDTSPRGDDVPDDPDGAYDFGLAAGFYCDATEAPWADHYQMHAYVAEELVALIRTTWPVGDQAFGISGHSMGGHGALTIALKHPDTFASVSAFAPIASPLNCPWGHKALSGYLGDDRDTWRAYDACALLEDGARAGEILVDQGDADGFLEEQLKPELLEAACQAAGVPLTLRRQAGYDHSYYFIASFIEDHLRWHARRLVR